jgi:hypothetical protein
VKCVRLNKNEVLNKGEDNIDKVEGEGQNDNGIGDRVTGKKEENSSKKYLF